MEQQQQRRQRVTGKSGSTKTLLSGLYVPQNAAAEFFRTATPEVDPRRLTRMKTTRVQRRKTSNGKPTDVKPEGHSEQPMDSPVQREPVSVSVLHSLSCIDPAAVVQETDHDPPGTTNDDQGYGVRNPGDRPDWTQHDIISENPRHSLKNLITPLFRHIPHKVRTVPTTVSIETPASAVDGKTNDREHSVSGE